MMSRKGVFSLMFLLCSESIAAFVLPKTAELNRISSTEFSQKGNNGNTESLDDNDESNRRRDVLGSIAAATVGGLMMPAQSVLAADGEIQSSSMTGANIYRAAKRPTAYRVDSTQPPTLLPIKNARAEISVLNELGKGSGTDKEAIVVDTVNLNNMLNKAVFGTIDAIQSVVSPSNDSSSPFTFVCLGLPTQPKADDVELASTLTTTMMDQAVKSKQKSVALGFAGLPYSTQQALNDYTSGKIDENILTQQLQKAGVTDSIISLYRPLWRTVQEKYNKSSSGKRVDLLALAPELEDSNIARKQGLQFVEPERRAQYVADPQGFIGQVTDPRFKLYTDRSLLKDVPENDESSNGFFAERILAHETAATAISAYALQSPASFVTVVAPMSDLRYLNGINGRIARICQFLASNSNGGNASSGANVSNNSVTTILLNPTAVDTLSKTRYLRLEIGTGPETLAYQTKVADYLWFSSSPKVNLIPRLMDG